jgi:hypothetical protein
VASPGDNTPSAQALKTADDAARPSAAEWILGRSNSTARSRRGGNIRSRQSRIAAKFPPNVGPIKVMLESGIELDDVLYTLRGKVDPRTDPGNKALASWSEHRFVMAVAESYGRRVIFPVLAQKLGRKA